ncbi:MAG: hypothetical protein P8Y82_11950 [Methyloceanibacter sp.]
MSARTFAAKVCLGAAEKVDAGQTLTGEERDEARVACGRAISATASIMQKYQFEEAYFAITGERYKY